MIDLLSLFLQKIGQCWLNTLFIVDECNQLAAGSDRLDGFTSLRHNGTNPTTSTLNGLPNPLRLPYDPNGKGQFSADEFLDEHDYMEAEEDTEEEEEGILGSSVSCSSSESCNSSSSSASSVSSRNYPAHFEEWPPQDVNYPLPSTLSTSTHPLAIAPSSHKKEAKKVCFYVTIVALITS